MENKFKLLILLYLIILSSCKKRSTKYDLSKLSEENSSEISSQKRGLISKDRTVYYVEKDLQTLTVYKNDKIKWQQKILTSCGFISTKPAIQSISLYEHKIVISFCKDCWETLDISNGNNLGGGCD